MLVVVLPFSMQCVGDVSVALGGVVCGMHLHVHIGSVHVHVPVGDVGGVRVCTGCVHNVFYFI